MPFSPRFLSDADLLKQARVDVYRSGGPGGQKRNKTSNAVRLHHDATGLMANATEFRSLEVNRLHAVRRLRLKIAVEVREAVETPRFEPPDWLLGMRRDGRLEVSHRHSFYAAVIGLILDLMHARGGNPAEVAVLLGVSTTTVIKLLAAESNAWAKANAYRKAAGLTPLTPRR